nr:hypothetical protein [uncultured Lichenicoccus sp.]
MSDMGNVIPFTAAGEAEIAPADEPKQDRQPIASKPATKQRVPIQVEAGRLHYHASAGEAAIMAAGIEVYQRGPNLVRPIWRQVPASKGRTTLAAGFGRLGTPALIDTFSQATTWQRYDGKSKKLVTIDPPTSVAQVLLSREGQWNFPAIAGIITCPTLRPDGSILSTPGYDEETRLYLVDDPTIRLLPAVACPTKEDAQQALSDLTGLLTDFPFADQRAGELNPGVHRAVALSGLITPVVRGACTVVPLHAYNATSPGSGKSYIVDLGCAIATGQACPVMSAAPDANETDKRLAGHLLEGFPIISIDNCNGMLGSDLLAQAVERPLVRLRRLGGSDIITIESRAGLYATGNGLRAHGDMARRTLKCDLDAAMERPELRPFAGDPFGTILADRGRFVSACLIIVRAYIMAGYPGQLPALASFEDWSRLVRSALVWLGCADPCESMQAVRTDDPWLTELREMVGLWVATFGVGTKLTARDAVDRCEDWSGGKYVHAEMRDALLRLAGVRGQVDTKRLAWWLRSHEKRLIGTQRFRNMGDNGRGVAQWAVEDVKPKAV